MKKAIIISMITIATLSLAACGKKEAAGVVVTAQDTGKDTTTSELVKGDSAGEKTSSGTQKTVTEKTTAAENGMDWEKYGETMFLGEWTCDNGETWILDNGYNLTIKSASFDEDKIGSWGYGADALTITIWNDKTQIEVNTFDENGEITGTEMRDYNGETYNNYNINKFKLSDDRTSGELEVTDKNDKTLKFTLSRVINEDRTVANYISNKKEFEAKHKEEAEEARKEELSASGANYESIKADEDKTDAIMQQLYADAEAAGMDVDSYAETLGGYDVIFNGTHDENVEEHEHEE